MPTEKIILPDFVIANLYKDNLVLGNDLKQTSARATTLPTQAPATVATSPEAKTPVTTNIGTTASVPTKVAAPAEKPVAAKPPQEPALKADPPKQWYLGNNGKHIGILIRDTEVAFISDVQLQFLSNILNACKLNLGDVALINTAHHCMPFSELKQKLQPAFLILFDLSAQDIQLPFSIPAYQVQPYDQCKFLLASSLHKMLDDSQDAKLEKSKLWISLKNMFQL